MYEKRFFFLIFVPIVENQTPIRLLLQIHTQNVLCILIPQLLKFWKIKIEIVKPHFLQ